MTHQIIPFNFQGANVRAIDADGEPWFVATDVAEALGYAKPFNAVSRHCKAATTTPKQGGGLMTIIPERDLYRLVMRSKLPDAVRFEEWVVAEVLPSIRKSGGYTPHAIPQTLPEALRLAADMAEQNVRLQLVVAEQAPKVEALDRLATADGSLCITDAAKSLQIRRKELIAILQARRWIYRRTGSTHYVAYQDKIQSGLMEHKYTTVQRPDKSEKTTEQARVTPKGLIRLAALIQEAA